MELQQAGSEPRDVLRALRAAVLGAGPAAAFGDGEFPVDVPAGTAVVIGTSGSTGVPKRVALSRSALTASALATEARLGSGAWLLALPATYIAGIQVLVRSLVAGREPAILSGSFSAEAFAAAARGMASSVGGERVPTFTALVPAQLQTLLDAEDRGTDTGISSFDAVLVGGQSVSPELRARASAAGVRMVRTYGATETSGGCVYDGVPLDDVRLRIDHGEVLVSSPTLADGYLGEPERTAQVFFRDADGVRWFRTGDLGAIEDGVLSVTGRADNVIISGGINVSLDRVERLVRQAAGFEAAIVVGVPDERWGEVPVVVLPAGDGAGGADASRDLDASLATSDPAAAASARTADTLDPVVSGAAPDPADAEVRTDDDREADLGTSEPETQFEALRDRISRELGVAARPARLIVVADLPLLPSGKPDRRTLRTLAAL